MTSEMNSDVKEDIYLDWASSTRTLPIGCCDGSGKRGSVSSYPLFEGRTGMDTTRMRSSAGRVFGTGRLPA